MTSNAPPQLIGYGPRVGIGYAHYALNPAYREFQQNQQQASLDPGQRDLLSAGAAPAGSFADFLRRGGIDDSSGRGPGLAQYQVDNFTGFDPETGRPLGFFGPPRHEHARAFQFEHDAAVQAIRTRLGRDADRFIQQGIFAQQSFRPGGSDPRLYQARANVALQRANLVQPLDLGADLRRHESFLARRASSKAATNQIIGGVIQAGATALGAAVGGPAGAAIGAGLGGAANAALTGGGAGQVGQQLSGAIQGAAQASQSINESAQADQTAQATGTAFVEGAGGDQGQPPPAAPGGPQVQNPPAQVAPPQGGPTQGGFLDDNGAFVPGPMPGGGTGGAPPAGGAPEGFGGGAGGMAASPPPPPSYGADGDFSSTALAAESARNLGPMAGRIAAEVLAAEGDTFVGIMDMQIQNLLADSYARSAEV